MRRSTTGNHENMKCNTKDSQQKYNIQNKGGARKTDLMPINRTLFGGLGEFGSCRSEVENCGRTL